jgi:hypothetical protein
MSQRHESTPGQVDPQVLNDARTQPGPAGDEALVAAAAWASFAAARRIGTWLYTPAPADGLLENGRGLPGREPPIGQGLEARTPTGL